MLTVLRRILKLLPTLLLAIVLAITVWITAVTASDPNEERVYAGEVNIEIVGQDPSLVLTSAVPDNLSLTLSAPRSVWKELEAPGAPVRVVADFSGLTAGTYELPLQVQIGIRPVRVVSYTPKNLAVTLEPLIAISFPITLVQRGELAVGYESKPPSISQVNATVSGPESLVNSVKDVRAILDLSLAHENINRALTLQALDENGQVVEGVSISPERVTATMEVTQRGGYRNVVVKVVISGQPAGGYRVTNVSVYPVAVTVYSPDPGLVDALPGYVDTLPIDLYGARDDIDLYVGLNLPLGVNVVGEQSVQVQVGIAAIEGSVTLSDMPVEVIGLDQTLEASISPTQVDIILSGPLPVLDRLSSRDIRVVLDLSGLTAGTYQLKPDLQFSDPDLRVESILPGSVQVTISGAGQVTPTPAK